MKYLIRILFISLICCIYYLLSAETTIVGFNQVIYNKEFRPIVKQLVEYPHNVLYKNAYNIPIILKTLGEKAATIMGWCEKTSKGNFITINKNIWNDINLIEKKVLIYHELGHCLMNREHSALVDTKLLNYKVDAIMVMLGLINTKESLPLGCPGSIMHPVDFTQLCIKMYGEYYSAEFFNQELTLKQFLLDYHLKYKGLTIF